MGKYISRENVLETLRKANIGGYITDRLLEIPTTDIQPVDRWIDAQKNPPPIVDRRSMTSESVLILRDNGRCAVAYYCYDAEDGNYWTTDDDKTMYAWEEVTHWQPLPELPKDHDIEEHIEVDRPDGNCLDCKFQYLENSDYWCSVCPGNPEDI